MSKVCVCERDLYTILGDVSISMRLSLLSVFVLYAQNASESRT